MKCEDTKRACTLLFQDAYIIIIFSGAPTPLRKILYTHAEREKDRVEECGAGASAVFLEGRQFVFSVGECAGQAETR